MTIKDQLELINLGTVLNDQFISKKLAEEGKIKRLLNRYSQLIDEFIKTYELPEDSVNDLLKD